MKRFFTSLPGVMTGLATVTTAGAAIFGVLIPHQSSGSGADPLPGNEGRPWLHPGRTTGAFEKLVAAPGLPPVRLHNLRRGAATVVLAGGADLKVPGQGK